MHARVRSSRSCAPQARSTTPPLRARCWMRSPAKARPELRRGDVNGTGIRRAASGLGALAVTALCALVPLRAAGDEVDCLQCHGASAAAGMPTEYQVDEKDWAASIHAQNGLECLGCHEHKDEV